MEVGLWASPYPTVKCQELAKDGGLSSSVVHTFSDAEQAGRSATFAALKLRRSFLQRKYETGRVRRKPAGKMEERRDSEQVIRSCVLQATIPEGRNCNFGRRRLDL